MNLPGNKGDFRIVLRCFVGAKGRVVTTVSCFSESLKDAGRNLAKRWKSEIGITDKDGNRIESVECDVVP